MNPMITIAIGLIGGLAFGLLVAWGSVNLLLAGIGVAVILAGAVLPNPFRGLFGLSIIGFMVAFIAAGGISLL